MIDFFSFRRTTRRRPLRSKKFTRRDLNRLLKRVDALESRTAVAA